MQPDQSQYPLLEEVSEVFRGEGAVAKRAPRLSQEFDGKMRALSASMELELMAEVGALVYPDRVVVGMRDVRWFPPAPKSPSDTRLVGRARREEDGDISVTLTLEPVVSGSGAVPDDLDAPIPVCRALLRFGHTYRPAPWMPRQLAAPRAEHLHNGGQLYALEEGPGVRVPDALQVVSWARLCEPGRLQGGLSHSRQLERVLPASRLQVAPAALEGSLHLAQWLWYSFSGEDSRVMSLSEATWYRMPRRDERLVCDVQLRGTSGGRAFFDSHLHDQDGISVLELRGLGVDSRPSREPALPLPRPIWQSFVKCLSPR